MGRALPTTSTARSRWPGLGWASGVQGRGCAPADITEGSRVRPGLALGGKTPFSRFRQATSVLVKTTRAHCMYEESFLPLWPLWLFSPDVDLVQTRLTLVASLRGRALDGHHVSSTDGKSRT